MPLIDNRKIIKNEIDYDKLSISIVNAIKVCKKENDEEKTIANAVEIAIKNIKNKENEENKKIITTISLMKSISFIFYGFVSLFLFIAFICCSYLIYQQFDGFNWNLFNKSILLIFCAMFSAIFGIITYETYHVEDINKIFNINTFVLSFVTTIMAFIALFQGGG